MDTSISLKVRVIRALINDNTVMTLMLGLVAILLALGFLFSDVHNSNYYLLEQLAGFKFWAMAFLVYGTSKTLSCLYRTPILLSSSASILGMWLWSYLILSFIVFDTTGTAPTEWMLLFTLIAELWSFSLLIYYNRYPLYKRISDADKRCKYISTDSGSCRCGPIDDSSRLTAAIKELEK